MTDTQLNIAMAECCGWEWKYFPEMGDGGSYGWVKDGCFPQNSEPQPFPKYTECLNACASAFEQCIKPSEELSRKYWLSLSTITKTKSPEGLIKIMLSITESTARQRTIAMLTALGKLTK